MLNSLILNILDDEEWEKRRKNQDKWRQKQLNIFYRSGKPIFNITLETQHIRSNNNPHHFIEKKYTK
jgi:hypothetical protein